MKPFKNSLWAILLLALSFSIPSLAAGFGPGGGTAIVGAASTVATKNLTANRALVSNSSGKIAVASSITSTELGYLDGVTSAIQTQFTNKADLSGGLVPTAQLGSGTANSTTFLRGDRTYATISAGGTEPVTNTLGSAAQSLSLTGLTGNSHTFRFDGVSNAGANDVFLTVNSDTAQTGYTWQLGYNVGGAMAYASLSNTSVLRNQLAANERFHVSGTVTRFYDGTNTYFTFDIFCQTPSGIGTGTIYTSAAGDVALTAINLRSSQATGIKSGASGSSLKIG